MPLLFWGITARTATWDCYCHYLLLLLHCYCVMQYKPLQTTTTKRNTASMLRTRGQKFLEGGEGEGEACPSLRQKATLMRNFKTTRPSEAWTKPWPEAHSAAREASHPAAPNWDSRCIRLRLV